MKLRLEGGTNLLGSGTSSAGGGGLPFGCGFGGLGGQHQPLALLRGARRVRGAGRGAGVVLPRGRGVALAQPLWGLDGLVAPPLDGLFLAESCRTDHMGANVRFRRLWCDWCPIRAPATLLPSRNLKILKQEGGKEGDCLPLRLPAGPLEDIISQTNVQWCVKNQKLMSIHKYFTYLLAFAEEYVNWVCKRGGGVEGVGWIWPLRLRPPNKNSFTPIMWKSTWSSTPAVLET